MKHNISLISRPCDVLGSTIPKSLNSWILGRKIFLNVLWNHSDGRKNYYSENYTLLRYNASVSFILHREMAEQWRFFCELAAGGDVHRPLLKVYLAGLWVHTHWLEGLSNTKLASQNHSHTSNRPHILIWSLCTVPIQQKVFFFCISGVII
jgi:hypothetical protein